MRNSALFRRLSTYVELKNFSDLAKLAAICRKQGIETIKINQDGVEFRLGERPTSKRSPRRIVDEAPETPQYTEEDLLNWSSGPV